MSFIAEGLSGSNVVPGAVEQRFLSREIMANHAASQWESVAVGRDCPPNDYWWVVFTQPHKEQMVEGVLASMGLETFLPMIRPAHIRADRRPWKPLFPRYLFVRAVLSKVPRSRLEWLPGVSALVSFGGEPARVPQGVIDLLRRRVELLNQHGYGYIAPGERVRITSGPLKDLEAIFERPISDAGRVRILVHILGRLSACEVDIEVLEPAGAAGL
jgi:transcriptional antiterminator RfaH